MDEILHQTSSPGERRERILTALRETGFVTIEGLAQAFGCSAQTVRRDLIAMEAAGLLTRFHGGAGLQADPDAPTRPTYSDKRTRHEAAKAEIAAVAVRLLSPGESVFLDVGTTVEALARELRRACDAGAITNVHVVCAGLNPAALLAGASGLSLEILPGEVMTPDGAITGAATAMALMALRLDHAFIGVSALDGEGAPWDFDPAKIAVKQAGLAAARSGFVLADTSKFARTAWRRVCQAGALEGIVCEAVPPPDVAHALALAGCALVLPTRD